ncbi:MAG: TIGR03619 family F420-dependent LLM class oxidoreductase, partial [Candidatus Binataceae bacterium]
LVIERDPITLAKEVASLDVLSSGRVILGIGGGWNDEEMADHGTPFKRRWKVLRERVLAMKEIWSKEVAEFHGEFVNFDPMWSWPKPIQPGGPPVLLGSQAKRCHERVVDFCDGWLPINRKGNELANGVKALREAADRAGRRFDSMQLGVFGVPPREDVAKQLVDWGFSQLIFGLPPAKADKVLPMLDTYGQIARKLH